MAEKKLYIDFGYKAEIDEVKKEDGLYKVGLKDQYAKLNFPQEFEEFIRDDIALSDVEVGISYPSFERKEIEDDKNRLKNVAIRIPLGNSEQDLILMGDIINYVDKFHGACHYYSAKGITLMDKGMVTCGEIMVHCDIYTRLDFDDGWNNEDLDGPTKYLNEEQIKSSALSIDFLKELNEKYVAEPYKKVLNTIDKWQLFLDSKTEIMNTDLDVEYSVDEGSEFLIAYYKNNCSEDEYVDKIKYLNISGNKEAWFRKQLPNTEAAPIFHMTHDFLKKDLEENEDIRKKFKTVTSMRSLIVSEKVKMVKNPKSEELTPKFDSQTKLQDSRISSKIEEEEIVNKEKIDDIITDGEYKKSKARIEVRNAIDKEIDKLVQSYSKKEIVPLLDDYSAEVTEEYRPECVAKIEKLVKADEERLYNDIEKTEDELKDLDGEHKDLEKMIEVLTDKRNELDIERKKAKTDLTKAKDDKSMVKASASLKSINKELEDVDKKMSDGEKRITKLISDIKANNKKLSELEEELDNIDEKYDLEEMVQEKIAPLVEKYREELLEKKKKELTQSMMPKYNEILDEKLNLIQSEVEDEVNEVLVNETIIRMHIFYRLDIPITDDVDSTIKRLNKQISNNDFFLYKDPSGDAAIIRRQRKALNYLKKGYVMNPFLATALFNSAKQTDHSRAEVVNFYSPRLNERQKEAVRKAISSNGMFLIRGPPGTGKTEVIAEITAQLVTNGKKVLIASENHKAVDNAFQRLPKIPILRRVRLFAGFASIKTESNQYSVKKLTRSFYSDIAIRLKKEVNKSQNAKMYADKLDDTIADLKAESKEVELQKKNADDVIKKISDIEAQLDLYNMKVSRDRNENAEVEMEISKLYDDIRCLERVEGERFDELTSSVDVTYLGGSLGQDTIRSLYAMKKPEIKKEFKILRDNPEFFDLLKRKAAADENEKKRLEVEILQSEFNEFEFKMASVFPGGIPEEDVVLDLKDKIADQIDLIIMEIRKNIEERRDYCSDTSRKENEIKELEKELQELRSDDAMKAYDDHRMALISKIQKVLADNSIHGVFKTPDEGIMIIEEEKGRIKKNAKSGLSDELQTSYGKMAEYLLDESVVEKDSESLNEKLLEYANVIGLTCTTSDRITTEIGDVDLNKVNLDVVIIDEVSKTSFLEILHPILYGKTVILVGDDKQLPPIYQSNVLESEMDRYNSRLVNPELEKEFREMYERSYFRDLYRSIPECNKVMLNVQYRMHPDIMKADNVFYNGELKYGGAEGNREHYLEIKGAANKRIISKNSHVVFIDVNGEESKGYTGGTSFVNFQEVDVIVNLLKKMEKNCTKDAMGIDIGGRKFPKDRDPRLSLGVICGYSDQAKLIRTRLKGFKFQSFNRSDDEQFMVDTVDNFQGDERDIIILSLVRSRPERSFMTIFNRINVAISRARCLLVVVGNANAFSSLKIRLDDKEDFVYRKIVDIAKASHGYFTGKDVMGD